MKRKNMIYVAVATAILFLLCGCSKEAAVTITAAEEDYVTEQEQAENITVEDQSESNSLLIHICGAVQNPGVYELTEGDRVCHAVEMAGGFTEEADEAYLNQAERLTDGMRIYIPTKDETAQEAESNFAKTTDFMQQNADSGLININTATMEQLCTLPGIGEGKAQNIIAYRAEKGGYGSIEEIMNVEGIKEGLFEKIRDKITVS